MKPIITFGVHIADVLGRYVSEIPPGQGLARIEEIRMTVAGTAAGTAVDLAKIGAPVRTVGALGDDTMGRFVRQTMADFGVDVSGLKTVTSAQTSSTILPIRPDGSRPALHVVGASAYLETSDVTDAMLAEAGALHLGGVCLMERVDGAPGAELLARCRANGVVTSVDCLPTGTSYDRDAILPLLPHTDFFFPSYEDALMLAGASTRADAIEFFLAQGVATLVITMGGLGVSISRAAEEEIRLPAYVVDVVDTTGCGDAFSAGFLAETVAGKPPREAAELGLAMGSMVATGLGSDAGIVDRASVEDFRARTPRGPLTD